jgi:putative colanic acid biosynthesis acetyltransferase WcaF
VIPTKQSNKYSKTWPIWTYLLLVIWRFTWLITCSWTPKFLNPLRLVILRLFGAKISGLPFVHSSVKIEIPWHISLKNRACLGDSVRAYSLGLIEIKEGATVAQESYLCTGTHDFNDPSLQLITKPITIGKNAFIGARAMILPGVCIGNQAIVGAMSVVSKSVPKNEVWAGNPASLLKKTEIGKHQTKNT